MSGVGPPDFSISSAERDGRLVVTLRGELDLATAGDVEEAVLGPVRDGRHVVLDLRELEFMDSSGVRVIVAAHGAAQDGDGRLTIVRAAPGGAVQRVLEISGLEDVLELVERPDS
jgi:anti-sigma B factor antagonist/stage II sporulation protein AA (anti-sigma F factor antagonist)